MVACHSPLTDGARGLRRVASGRGFGFQLMPETYRPILTVIPAETRRQAPRIRGTQRTHLTL